MGCSDWFSRRALCAVAEAARGGGGGGGAALDRRAASGRRATSGHGGDDDDARAPCVLPKLFGARCTIDFSHPMRKILRGGAGDASAVVARRRCEEGAGGGQAECSGAVQRAPPSRPSRRADSRTATPLWVGDHGAKSALAAPWHVARPTRRSLATTRRWRRADAPAVRPDARAARTPSEPFHPSVATTLVGWNPECADSHQG